MAQSVSDANFKTTVLDSPIPVMVDFWATWCGPCRQVSPIVDELAQEYEGKVLVCKCDVDNATEVPATYLIRSIPTLLFFKDGVMVHKIVGATNKQTLVEQLDKML